MIKQTKPSKTPKQKNIYVSRLRALRTYMRKLKLDGCFVPREDEYLGENVPPENERLAWLTGFTGSAGLAVILQNHASLLVDGRYTLQAKQQAGKTGYLVGQLGLNGLALCLEKTRLKEKRLRLGFDPRNHPHNTILAWRAHLKAHNITFVPLPKNPIDGLKKKQTSSYKKIVPFPIDYAGVTSSHKRRKIGKDLQKRNLDGALLTDPASISWLLNVRGNDVPYTPFALSFGMIWSDGSFDWFVDEARIGKEVQHIIGRQVRLHAPKKMQSFLRGMGTKKILCDKYTTPHWFAMQLGASKAKLIWGDDPCALPKACKNKTEQKGAIIAHKIDGLALVRFLAWLEGETQKPHHSLTEYEASQKLAQFRKEHKHCKDLSFASISATAYNAALPHYTPASQGSKILQNGDIYLIDSGGQYLYGTTDVTRTILIGKRAAPKAITKIYTHILKGYIGLASCKFPAGTNGTTLDTFARAPLWQLGLDFDHGTGHGVGSYLSVHEGPQNISSRGQATFYEGMIVSNEPGYYKKGQFGIRIEGLQMVVPEKKLSNERHMFGFMVLTLAPIDRRLIDKQYLTSQERNWLNAYHARVYKTLQTQCDVKTRYWLKRACKKI